jgi:riboflavin synthase
MFTGLIEAVSTVKSARRSEDSMLLTVDLGELAGDSGIGDSIAVNGACLTVSSLEGSLASFELSTETLEKTTLNKLTPSSQVNVERSLKATDRFGGHIVLGHIDGKATIKAVEKHGRFADIKFAAGPDLLDGMVVKGSVAVDGISLTIADMDQNSFSVAIIPETLKRTTLSRAKIGEEVNIETDIIVKAVKKQIDKILPQTQPLTAEKLKELGF